MRLFPGSPLYERAPTNEELYQVFFVVYRTWHSLANHASSGYGEAGNGSTRVQGYAEPGWKPNIQGLVEGK